MNLVIVESPTKANTIKNFLDKNYKIGASYGHVRDLPKNKIGVDIENNFKPTYIIIPKTKKIIQKLKKEAKKAESVILATDEDREGEAISWHLIEVLELKKQKIPTKRIVFHEITKSAIEKALKNPRDINMNLVNAQQARRILDRLVGYELSPFLWKKITRGLSAGRVQSVAVRLIVEREKEIENFKPQEYWQIEALLKSHQTQTKPQKEFLTKLYKKNKKVIDKLEIKSEKEAEKILKNLEKAIYKVIKIEKKETFRNPPLPFITSTLQQEASKKFGFSAKQTMFIAQQLYEGLELGEKGRQGLITYMRTDSLNLSKESIESVRKFIKQEYGDAYLPSNPITYKTKSKSAQEAHEAIRPTNVNLNPELIQQFLNPNQYKIYKLIWQRFVACQMKPAIFDSSTILIEAKSPDSESYIFKAMGLIQKFDGFLKVYPLKFKESTLPDLTINEILDLVRLNKIQKFTQPPSRYTEASLIKTLENYGIGRPSTYAPIISTIQERKYVKKIQRKYFQPTDIGILVNDVLVKHFPEIVDINFTAKIEDNLDEIAQNNKNWILVLRDFYKPFKENLEKKYQEVSKKELTEKLSQEICEKCGAPMVEKFGRFGKFLSCSNYPTCKNKKNIKKFEILSDEEKELNNQKIICEKCGAEMKLRKSRFGLFWGCSNFPKCRNIKKLEKNKTDH